MNKTMKQILMSSLMVSIFALGVSVIAPSLVGAQSNPLDILDPNGKTLMDYFKIIIDTALYIVGAVSVLMLIYGGIRYTTSGGNVTNVTAAKNTVLYAIVGIVVSLLSFAIVRFVLSSLGAE